MAKRGFKGNRAKLGGLKENCDDSINKTTNAVPLAALGLIWLDFIGDYNNLNCRNDSFQPTHPNLDA